jgi:acyl-[acyl-carrier-protein]-phospholipid O-acyltransferase/long-chain-fatty-acid--[acyl-carrier-protein] ligase
MAAFSTHILHKDRIPDTGVLVIPGRLNFEQALQLEKLFADRKITWLIEESSHHDPSLRSHLEKSDSGAMFSARDAAPALAGEQLQASLENQGVLIFVPGRVTVRNATACHIPSAQLSTLCAFGLPVLPVAIDCPRESGLRIERRSSLPHSVLAIGHPIAGADASVPIYQQALLEAAEEAFRTRALFKGSLAMALLEGLRKYGSKNRLFDGADDSELPYQKVLAAALAFSRVIRDETDQARVAIVLPPGKAGLIANLAVVFAGKTPVNLNFTAGPEAIRSCIRQAGVDRFITADPFVRKISGFPWPPNRDLILIERVLPSLKKKMLTWAIVSKLLPACLLGFCLGLNKRRGDDEATLLFTSGSSGEPKGVVLSHRNILANVNQFGSRLDLTAGSAILGCLPLFHSFGCTVTLWFPCIEGINLVTYPSPLETQRLAELIALHQVNVLLATPTFLRGYMKRIDPAQLASLQLVVTGAEKLPLSLADAFEEKFGIRPQEGYGLTETSPGSNVNLPDPEPVPRGLTLASSRNGSVGQLLPGMAIRITDPATDAVLPINRQGVIWFRGANVFSAYLGDPKNTAAVLDHGWFRTGDIGRVDQDGFLFIEGRISRFSKIAGEMVPHETIEAAVNKVLGLDGEAERKIAIIGVPDPQKGEAIWLLSTIAGPTLEQECIDLRYKLLDDGIPSLWCPRQIVPVREIPVLASGKLDLKGCQAIIKPA